MDTVEQLTPPEGSGGTVSSTEIGGQPILWKGRGTNNGQPAPAEIPDEETAGSLQLTRARLEGPLDDDQQKIGGKRHITDLSRGNTDDEESRRDPTHQPVQFWTNVSMIVKSHFTNCPKEITCSVGRVGNTRISQNSLTI